MTKYEELFKLIKQGGFLKEKELWDVLQALNGLETEYKAKNISIVEYQQSSFEKILKALNKEFPERYTVHRRLSSRGGVGSFYEVESKKDKKTAVMKIAQNYELEKTTTRDKLLDEILSVFAVSEHKNIPTARYFGHGKVCDNFEEDYFIVMDYIKGPTLFELATDEGLKINEMIKHLEGISHILDALAYLHTEKEIMHRSCHAGNMIYDREESKGYLTGLTTLAKVDDNAQLTQTGKVIGIYPFLAPETFTGAQTLGFKSDVYSMGASIAMYLDGAYPRGYQEGGPQYKKRVSDEIEAGKPITIEKDYEGSRNIFSDFIEKATQVDMRKRYENGKAMSDEFKQRLEKYKKNLEYRRRFDKDFK